MKNKNFAIIAAVSFLLGLQAMPSFADTGEKSQGDVVVKKNADGTVEAYDANSAPAQAAPSSAQPRVIYRLKNDVGTRRISGVSVRTNPDGSIDTFDDSSPRPSPRASARGRARARTTGKSTASKKSKSSAAKTHH